MNQCFDNEHILIAKRCPECGSLVSAKRITSRKGIVYITERKCCTCGWISPLDNK